MLVLWVAGTLPMSVVTLDSLIGTSVAILSILFTIAVGWQIINAIELKEQLRISSELKTDILNYKDTATSLADGHSYYCMAETYRLNGLYISSFTKYVSAASCFFKANEPNFANNALGRALFVIREIMRIDNGGAGTYMIDYDLYEDDALRLDILFINKSDARKDYNIDDLSQCFTHYISRITKHITVANGDFVVYRRDAAIKQRPNAIYLIMEGDKIIAKTMEWRAYKGYEQYNPRVQFDSIAICDNISPIAMQSLYNSINAGTLKKQEESN